jgi:dTDP-4-amino-4,6-dideoxygalactose transaminase
LRRFFDLQPAYAELGYGAGAFPLTEAIHREVPSLPMGPHLSEAQQQSVDSVLNHP